MELEFSEAALADLLEIMTYIAEDNPTAAAMVSSTIHRQIAMLAEQPGIGRPGRMRGTKELVLAGLPYVVPYKVKRGVSVTILRVMHTSRQWPA